MSDSYADARERALSPGPDRIVHSSQQGGLTATFDGEKRTLPAPLLIWWPAEHPDRIHHIQLPLSGEFTIGRDPRCHFELPESAACSSRVHAELQINSGQVRLLDLSRHGTFVFDRDGSPRRIRDIRLRHGQEVAVDTIRFFINYPKLIGHTTPEHDIDTPERTDKWSLFGAAIAAMWERHGEDLGKIRKGAVEKEIGESTGLGTRQVERMFLAAGPKYGITGRGPTFVLKLAKYLAGIE